MVVRYLNYCCCILSCFVSFSAWCQLSYSTVIYSLIVWNVEERGHNEMLMQKRNYPNFVCKSPKGLFIFKFLVCLRGCQFQCCFSRTMVSLYWLVPRLLFVYREAHNHVGSVF